MGTGYVYNVADFFLHAEMEKGTGNRLKLFSFSFFCLFKKKKKHEFQISNIFRCDCLFLHVNKNLNMATKHGTYNSLFLHVNSAFSHAVTVTSEHTFSEVKIKQRHS